MNTKTIGLNLNIQGAVRCENHAPFRGSDTWINQSWKRIDRKVVTENYLKCEVCK